MQSSDTFEFQLNQVVQLIRDSNRILFITGAGISADSGLPTYRGVGGLYNNQKTDEGYPIESCLSAPMFRIKPEITWKYMLNIAEAVFECRPNVAHRIIADWERQFKSKNGKVVVLTQNIDGYHRAAGAQNVLEVHGTLHRVYCTKCSWKRSIPDDGNNRNEIRQLVADWKKSLPPRCPECDSVIRPDIVMFDEMLPRDVLDEFDNEFQDGRGFDLVVSVGTSAMFPYITGPVVQASHCGKKTVEINPTKSDLSHRVDVHLPLRAAEAFERMDRMIKS